MQDLMTLPLLLIYSGLPGQCSPHTADKNRTGSSSHHFPPHDTDNIYMPCFQNNDRNFPRSMLLYDHNGKITGGII